MTRDEAAKVVRLVEFGWPQRDLSPESAVLYLEALGDLPYRLTAEAVGALLRTDDYRPTIATIRREVCRAAGLMPPELGEALEQAQRWLVWRNETQHVNGTGYEPRRPDLHPVVESCCDGLPPATDPTWRHLFRASYREAVEAAERGTTAQDWQTTKAIEG